MNKENLIPITLLCKLYDVEMSFFTSLNDSGLIEICTVEETFFISEEKITELEKIIRLYHELNLNMEGIDIVFNLLLKIEEQKSELDALKERLRIYENDEISEEELE